MPTPWNRSPMMKFFGNDTALMSTDVHVSKSCNIGSECTVSIKSAGWYEAEEEVHFRTWRYKYSGQFYDGHRWSCKLKGNSKWWEVTAIRRNYATGKAYCFVGSSSYPNNADDPLSRAKEYYAQKGLDDWHPKT